MLDKVFVKHFMKDDTLAETFLEAEGQPHKEAFLQYTDDLVQEAESYFHNRTSKAHGDAIVARLYYYLFVRSDIHCSVPFLTQTMAAQVDQRLSQSQQGLADVSASRSHSAIQECSVDRQIIALRSIFSLSIAASWRCDPWLLTGSQTFPLSTRR
jgi:hypothetical protein